VLKTNIKLFPHIRATFNCSLPTGTQQVIHSSPITAIHPTQKVFRIDGLSVRSLILIGSSVSVYVRPDPVVKWACRADKHKHKQDVVNHLDTVCV